MDAGILLLTSILFSGLSLLYGITQRQPTNAFVEVPTGKE